MHCLLFLHFVFLWIIAEKKNETEWLLKIHRCSLKDKGTYSAKVMNNVGCEVRNWKILVVTGPTTTLSTKSTISHKTINHDSNCEKENKRKSEDRSTKDIMVRLPRFSNAFSRARPFTALYLIFCINTNLDCSEFC